jgi:hypothetical protein
VTLNSILGLVTELYLPLAYPAPCILVDYDTAEGYVFRRRVWRWWVPRLAIYRSIAHGMRYRMRVQWTPWAEVSPRVPPI